MAYFRITPGTPITVTPSKALFEVGDDIWLNVAYYVDAKDLAPGYAWTCYCVVHIFGQNFTSDSDEKFNEFGTTQSEYAVLDVYLGKATTEGTFDGYVQPKAHVGV